VLAALLGCALFLLSWGLLHVPPLSRHQIIDTPTYQRFGNAVVDGQVPYRDFDIEYPPGALPVFILPSLAAEDDYRTVFEVLMLLCGLGAVVLVARTLDAAGADRRRLLAGCALAGLAPLVLGTVILTRFDLWPALLSVGALAALAGGRERLGLGVLGLAVSAKIYPAVLLPIALLYVARRRGGREALVGLGIFAAVLAAVLVPFAVLSWDGLLHAFTEQARRPLQIESLGSSVLLAVADLGGYEPTIVSSFGSQNLSGQLPDTLAGLQTAVQIVAVIAVWILFAISPRGTPQLLAASAAAVAAFAAFGKVLSPQFLIWLIPLVALVLGRLGAVAWGLFALALALTHAYFPKRYFDGLLTLDSGPVWLLVARNVAFVALVVLLSVALSRAEPSPT
jgi:Glycosyltransferase family 87